jgi:Flp pilus assembly protein TadG
MLSSLRRPGAAIRRHIRTRTRGQSLVELALILPVFMLFFAAILDLGRIAAAQVAIQNAAREGAFAAAVTPADFDSSTGCPADGKTNTIYCRIKLESSNGVSIAPTDVTVTCSPAVCSTGIGHTVSVVVSGHFRLLTPLMGAFFNGNQNVTFTASSVQNIATFPASPVGLPAPTPTPTPTPTGPVVTPSPTPTLPPTCLLPSAGFTMTVSGSNNRRPPQTVTVTDTSTSINCGIDSWIWDWGDGTTGSGQVPGSHTYLAPNPDGSGSYTVKLTVANAAGAKTSGGQQVQVR